MNKINLNWRPTFTNSERCPLWENICRKLLSYVTLMKVSLADRNKPDFENVYTGSMYYNFHSNNLIRSHCTTVHNFILHLQFRSKTTSNTCLPVYVALMKGLRSIRIAFQTRPRKSTQNGATKNFSWEFKVNNFFANFIDFLPILQREKSFLVLIWNS